MTDPPSGRLANASGRLLEDMIRTTLTANGFAVVSYRAYHAHPDRFGAELLLTHVPYPTIYGHTGHTEFVLRSDRYALTSALNASGSNRPAVWTKNFRMCISMPSRLCPNLAFSLSSGARGPRLGPLPG